MNSEVRGIVESGGGGGNGHGWAKMHMRLNKMKARLEELDKEQTEKEMREMKEMKQGKEGQEKEIEELGKRNKDEETNQKSGHGIGRGSLILKVTDKNVKASISRAFEKLYKNKPNWQDIHAEAVKKCFNRLKENDCLNAYVMNDIVQSGHGNSDLKDININSLGQRKALLKEWQNIKWYD